MSEPFLALLPQLLALIEAADEPLTLTELSARSGYSAWHLHRQFRFLLRHALTELSTLAEVTARSDSTGLPANAGD